ncbi:hypothetical protein Hamer_G023118 [Homarus americanus]|uniref:Uncharacterized protein n=1 Tax=Homarus americanus TaxID=6706 RepID=A0A8J5K2P3_HOMAM|nr:hypothetical protein Hamer_G023118 [Homarus americanus]
MLSWWQKRGCGNRQADILLAEAAQLLRRVLIEVKKNANPLPLAVNTQHFQKEQTPTAKKCINFILDVISQDSTNPNKRETSRSVTTCYSIPPKGT